MTAHRSGEMRRIGEAGLVCRISQRLAAGYCLQCPRQPQPAQVGTDSHAGLITKRMSKATGRQGGLGGHRAQHPALGRSLRQCADDLAHPTRGGRLDPRRSRRRRQRVNQRFDRFCHLARRDPKRPQLGTLFRRQLTSARFASGRQAASCRGGPLHIEQPDHAWMQMMGDIRSDQHARSFHQATFDIGTYHLPLTQGDLQSRMAVHAIVAGASREHRPPWAERDAPGPGARRRRGHAHRRVRSRSAFATTDTDERLIANAAIIGLNRRPNTGYSTPAAIGTPSAL